MHARSQSVSDCGTAPFWLDTALAGKRNTGHQFRSDENASDSGVLGRGLSDEDGRDLIEYLKTL